MKELTTKIQEQFNKMVQMRPLFRSNVSGDELWHVYLASFLDGDDPVFRNPESSVHNCNYCKNFMRRYGNIVSVDDSGQIHSLFDIEIEGEYKQPMKALSDKIIFGSISGVFVETQDELYKMGGGFIPAVGVRTTLGMKINYKRYTKEEAELYGVVKPNELRTFNHLHIDIPIVRIDKTGKSIARIEGEYKSKYEVFKRGMSEISLEVLELVRDLINQDSLLDGKAHLNGVLEYIKLKKANPNGLTDSQFWKVSNSMHESLAKFRNTLIGTLCVDIASGEELNLVCEAFNKRVDPQNYHKAKAPISTKQIAEARRFVEENGYADSFNRRLATIDDIKASEILHINAGKGEIKEVSVFDKVKATKPKSNNPTFDNVEEVSIDKFMTDILPLCSSVEAFFSNKHKQNLVALTTCVSPDSKRMFKWDNNYSKTFIGGLAGKSYIKNAVEVNGGKVDGVLRFSLMWAEGDPTDDSDLDAHCVEPTGRIWYSNMRVRSGGNLDIDITHPVRQRNNKNVAENITWPSLDKMKDGEYIMIAHNYADRGNKYFDAEIEMNGEIFNYRNNSRLDGFKQVANVYLKDGKFSIEHIMPLFNPSKAIWGIDTQEFHKVNLVCKSPNHWGDNNVGSMHYLFMLEDCISEEDIRGFHNEDLCAELNAHKKVMEVLGSTTKIESTKNQLSGLGFNSTVRDELLLKCSGSFNRVIKVKF